MKIEIKAIFEIDELQFFDSSDNEAAIFFYTKILGGEKTFIILHSNETNEQISSTNKFKFQVIEP